MQVWIARWGLLAIMVGVGLEADSTMLFGGAAAHFGVLRFDAVLGAGILGAFLWDVAIFAAARRLAPRLKNARPVRLLESRFGRWIDKIGPKEIAFTRFVNGTRIPSLALWATRGLTWRRFLVIDLAGCVLWATIVAVAGYLGSHVVGRLLGDVVSVERWALGAVVTGIAIGLLVRWLVSRKAAAAGPVDRLPE